MRKKIYILFTALCCLISFFGLAQKKDTVQTTAVSAAAGGGTPPANPPNPTASTNFCGAKTLTRTSSPPLGVQWYWQTVANGIDLGNSNATYPAPQSSTYYLRAYRPSTDLWSTGAGYVTVTVNPNPAPPSTPSLTDYCSYGVLTRGTPPSGITWYWQGTISSGTSTSNSASTYTVNGSGTYYIRGLNNPTGCWGTSTSLIVSLTTPPGAPPTPLSSGNSCGDVTLSFNGTPPQFMRWCWQTSASGTNMTNMTTNYVVSTSGTYYLRAYDLNSECWSSGASQISVTVNQPPSTPAPPTSAGSCGVAVLTRSDPSTGLTWYWQGNNASGTSISNSNATYDATASGTYYLRARNNTTFCWSTASANVTVTVNPLPIMPSAPVIQNNCGTGVLARSAPPANETWYWQGTNASGTSTIDANATYTVPSSGTYYLRAQNNTTLCWSSASSGATITVNPLPASPANPVIENTCGTGSLSRGTPAAGITWYWQGTSPSGTSTADAGLSYSASATGTYYLRAQNNTTACWSSASSGTAITVNPAVGNPSPVNGTREEPGVVNLSAAFGTNGNNNKWYDSQTNGNLLSSTSAYAPSVVITTIFYVGSYNTTTLCESARVPVTATIYPKPVISATGSSFMMGNTITLSVSNNTYTTYSWNRDNSLIATTPSVEVDRPGTYTVTVTKTGMTGSGTSLPQVLKRSVDEQTSMNYIIVNSVLKDNVTLATDIDLLTANERSRSLEYIGGLGNPLQSIASQASPGKKDIVQTPKYDIHGRQLEQYLPYISNNDDSKFRPQALDNMGYTSSEQYLFYQQSGMKLANDTKPYSKIEIESSPMQRSLTYTGTGHAWHAGNKKIISEYLLNRASENIRLWKVVSGMPVSTAAYADYELHVNVVTDENGNKTKVYVDKPGRPVLKATEANATDWLRTAFVYDDFGRLTFSIAPEGVKTGNLTPNQAWLDQWTFQYKYDALGRVIEYKAPAGGWLYTVYDVLNRPVLTQNADQRSRAEWAFVKYDVYGRPVVTGFKVISSSTRSSVQASVDAQSFQYELTTSDAIGYTLNRSYPTAVAEDLLSISYFDSYSFLTYPGWDAEALSFAFVAEQGSTTYATAVTGLPTGGKIKLIGTSTWLNAVQYYDKRYRPLQVIAENHLGGLDRSTNAYNNLRQVTETRYAHHNAAVIVLRKMNYDHAGRVTKIYQNINNAPTDQLVGQYEYNALGQLVDKKLHNMSGSEFLQSVDYRYNIRGWITSINNAQLNVSSANNDDINDYFGIEFLYNTSESGLNNPVYYNGNIGAVKWKGIGSANNAEDQQSYAYSYDKADRLLTAASQMHDGVGWTKEIGALNEIMTYDQNGNIKTLQRNNRKHQIIGTVPDYGTETVDNLTFTYSTLQGNQLQKVEDAIPVSTGAGDFKNNANDATEYTYNTDGNLTADMNKGIARLDYNILGKVSRVEFSDGRVITYLYDASGNKLKMQTYQGSTLQNTTDYTGGFVYENASLSFFGSPEGRVVKNGSSFDYQYAIGDHQGNTRVVFSAATPTPVAPQATFEGDANDGTSQYRNVSAANIVSFINANHTPTGSKVVRLNQGYNTGPAKSLKVYPGDKIDMEVWTYFEGSSGWGTTSTGMASFITNVALAFGGASGGAGESGTIYNGVNSAYGTMGMAANQGDTKPSAYLNYILFDKEYKLLDMGWKAVPATANMAKQQISIPTVNIKEAGYIFVYLSYEAESNNWVYFDDFKVTHTKTNVIQYNEYYPFGLQASKSWTRENSANNFLYNAGSELNTITGWYETFFRGYDATLGRFSQVDPLAYASSSHSPYNYGLNDPVYYNDPMGDYVEPTLKPDKPQGGSLRNYPGITGFDTYVAELYGGDPIPGYGGEMSAPSGTTEFSIGGVTITIDWSQVGADGLSINMNDDGSANSAMIFQDEGGAGFWIDYAFGPGGGDVAVESHKSQFVSGWAQQGLMDVTDKFNEQLRQTEKFFNDMGIAFDAMDMPYPGMTRAMKLDFFKSQVGTKKPYDIKQPGKGFSRGEIGNRAIYNGVEYNYDDFGNINYGVAARALGLTYLEAVAGAGYNQTFQTQTPDWSNPSGFFDHSRDTQMINFGFNMLVPKK